MSKSIALHNFLFTTPELLLVVSPSCPPKGNELIIPSLEYIGESLFLDTSFN